jgi:hypothetical protein
VQANLGLRRVAQCEKCLALASVLALKEPQLTTNNMRSQLSRLYGQLFSLQVPGCGGARLRVCLLHALARPRGANATRAGLPECTA